MERVVREGRRDREKERVGRRNGEREGRLRYKQSVTDYLSLRD